MTEGKKILLVDDESDAVEFVRTMIEDIGDYEVITAEDGEEGLSKARAERPDLIILDVQMPKKDGFMVFSELNQYDETQNIPVIMLTGVASKTGIGFSSKDMGDFLGKKPAAYIEKPVDPTILEETIGRILSSNVP